MLRLIPAVPFWNLHLNIAWPALSLRLPGPRSTPAMPRLTRDEIEDIFHDDLTRSPLVHRRKARSSTLQAAA